MFIIWKTYLDHKKLKKSSEGLLTNSNKSTSFANKPEILKRAIKYKFKIGFYSEINCEIDNTSTNERQTFKNYRNAYNFLFEENLIKKFKPKNSKPQFQQTFLEILAVARLLNCRIISFILVQDIDIKTATEEFIQHLNLLKGVFFDNNMKL